MRTMATPLSARWVRARPTTWSVLTSPQKRRLTSGLGVDTPLPTVEYPSGAPTDMSPAKHAASADPAGSHGTRTPVAIPSGPEPIVCAHSVEPMGAKGGHGPASPKAVHPSGFIAGERTTVFSAVVSTKEMSARVAS